MPDSESARKLRNQALASLAEWVHSTLPLEDILQAAVEGARTILGTHQAGLSLTNPDGKSEHQALSTSEKYVDSPDLLQLLLRPELGVLVCQARHPVTVPPRELPAMRGSIVLPGWMGAPLRRRSGEPLGFLQVADKEFGEFDTEDEALLVQITQLVSMAIENTLLVRAEQNARQVAETLRVANLALTQNLELDSVLETLLDYLGWIIPYDRASVLLVENADSLTLRSVRNYLAESSEESLQADLVQPRIGALLQQVLADKNTVIAGDLQQDDPLPDWSRIRAWMGVPLVYRTHTIGVVVIEKTDPQAFTEEHQRLADALAAQAVVALRNARLFEALRESEERYRAATELASDYAYAFRVDENGRFVREWITDAFERITGFEPSEVSTEGGWASITFPDDRPIALQRIQALLLGQQSVKEFRIVTKDEHIRWVRDHSRPVWDVGRTRIIRIYGATQDITERKQYEREQETIATIASALRLAQTRAEMIPIILHKTLDLLAAEGAALILRDPGGDLEVLAHGQGCWQKADIPARLAGLSVTDAVIETGQPYWQMDVSKDRRMALPEDLGGVQAVACVPLMTRQTTLGVLWAGRRTAMIENEVRLLSAIADISANAIHRATLYDELMRAYDATIEALAKSLELRDEPTEGHSQRVADLTLRLARAMGMSEPELIHVRRGAYLHDIGKIGIPDSILQKEDALTEAEWTVMRMHPLYAYKQLSPIAFLRPALDIPHCHHERWDGSGYPRGLKGEEIPLAARIFAVVDVCDALMSSRPYHEPWSLEQTRQFIREQAGAQFDPRVVEAFLQLDL